MRGIALPAALLLLLLAARPADAQIPPDADWRSFATEHFRVTFEEGLEPVARRAAERAEHAYALLSSELVRSPRGQIELVVANNVDLANGYATPFPTNRIVIYAHTPADETTLSFTDDWIELVVLHELVHIFHLDYAGGVWRPLRAVFGRNPLLFPEVFVPSWVVEGLATYVESAQTRAGRVRGSFHEMVLRTAILEDRFFSIDRASGDPVSWPAGSTRYVYGSLFFDFLARRYGREGLTRLVETAGSRLVPYRTDAAARRAFGISFSRAWREWEDSLSARYGALEDSLRAGGVTEPEVLTAAGRLAEFPRFSPSGAAIAYAASTGREEPSMRLLRADGSERVVAERTSLGPAAWTPGGDSLLFAQLEFVDPYRIYSDLYRAGLDGGEERLTRGARFWEPDLHPDGRRVLGVADAEGTNVLEIRDRVTGEVRRLTEPSLGVAWSVPRWSPTGDRIAVGRWRVGGFYDVVLLDTAGTVLREVTDDRAVDAAPAWSPDGRHVLFSSDRTGIPDLYAWDTREERLQRVTRVLTGAFQPTVSPDGRWIAFSFYRADGFHIARIPFAPEEWTPAPPVRAEVAAGGALPDLAATAGGDARPYSPWRSLAPSYWLPLVDAGTSLGAGFGATTSAEDVVGRHQWSAQAVLYPDATRLEGGALYRYSGWGNPVLDVRLEQDWSVFREEGAAVGRGGAPLPTALLSRDRELSASLFWLRRRWRSSAWLGLGGEARDLDRVWDQPERADTLRATQYPLDVGATLHGGYSTARGYAYSVGPQEGFRVSGALEGHRYLEPIREGEQSPGYVRFTGRGRAFQDFVLPGFAHHVAALRLDVGAETGSVSPGFSVGGASGGAAPLPVDVGFLGGGVSFPVRGYREGAQVGTRAFTASAEYRFPLRMVERGFRLVPVFLNRAWGDVFVDAGGAWCPGACERGLRGAARELRPLLSAGAELNLDLTTGFIVDLPLRFGVAVPLREPGAGRAEAYVRVGRSF